MIDERCLGPGVDPRKISPDAQVGGASYLTGPRTSVGPRAVVRDSRLHDAAIDAGAVVVDSIFVAEGPPGAHKCDAAGRITVSGADYPRVAGDADLSGCTFINSSIGARSMASQTCASDCRLGPDNTVTNAKLVIVNTGSCVQVSGPTEVSEAFLGHHTVIDKRGYYEGVFSNVFRQLRFNGSTGRLEVTGTIDLPHVSRYGLNTVNSTNSGKLLPQPGGVLAGLGPHRGLWHDDLLSHEQIELGPCCWVAPWTKVIGQSPMPHRTDDELVNDDLMTYVMPFAVAGYGGDLTRGTVMPGELSIGIGPKQRRGAWAFTYAPDAVMAMVRRLYQALEPARRSLADTIVEEALRVALEMTKAAAARRNVDLEIPAGRQKPGWPGHIASTYALLTAHLEAGLWQFKDGEPTGWHQQAGRWTHSRINRLLAVAPDALDKQVTEDEILSFDDLVPPACVAVRAGEIARFAGEPLIDPGAKAAKVSPTAFIGPGCRIGPGSVVDDGAAVWNSVLRGCKVAPGARVERSILTDSEIGARTVVRSCRISDSTIAEDSTAQAAAVTASRLAPKTTISAFADLLDVRSEYGTILGGMVHSADIRTHLMSMHMAGACSHLAALPTAVELAGRQVLVPAIPMLGGGALVRGTTDAPVEMECCFIGSNAVIEAGTFVSFGCFILGELGPSAGLLPFTVSTGGGPSRHQIAAALGVLASTVMTHFLNWTYQAVGPEGGPAAAELVRQVIQRGIAVIQRELASRSSKGPSCREDHARYRSLRDYSDGQLLAGLEKYRRGLKSGAWDIAFGGGQLRFSSPKGRWLERQGAAFWHFSHFWQEG